VDPRSGPGPTDVDLTSTPDDSAQVFDMAFVIVDVDLIVDPER
jgi:hypothetical protein